MAAGANEAPAKLSRIKEANKVGVRVTKKRDYARFIYTCKLEPGIEICHFNTVFVVSDIKFTSI